MHPTDKSGIEAKVAAFVAMRDAKAEINQAAKDAVADLDLQMDEIRRSLLDTAKELNVDSMKTSAGTFFRTVKTRYWTSDWEEMHTYVVDNACPEFLEKRLNQGAVKDFLEANPDAKLPGLQVESEYVVNVRRS